MKETNINEKNHDSKREKKESRTKIYTQNFQILNELQLIMSNEHENPERFFSDFNHLLKLKKISPQQFSQFGNTFPFIDFFKYLVTIRESNSDLFCIAFTFFLHFVINITSDDLNSLVNIEFISYIFNLLDMDSNSVKIGALGIIAKCMYLDINDDKMLVHYVLSNSIVKKLYNVPPNTCSVNLLSYLISCDANIYRENKELIYHFFRGDSETINDTIIILERLYLQTNDDDILKQINDVIPRILDLQVDKVNLFCLAKLLEIIVNFETLPDNVNDFFINFIIDYSDEIYKMKILEMRTRDDFLMAVPKFLGRVNQIFSHFKERVSLLCVSILQAEAKHKIKIEYAICLIKYFHPIILNDEAILALELFCSDSDFIYKCADELLLLISQYISSPLLYSLGESILSSFSYHQTGTGKKSEVVDNFFNNLCKIYTSQ